jgi:hypothetical protein
MTLDAKERARINRTLKRLPHISKRGKVSLLDLFPHLKVAEVVKVPTAEKRAQ